MATSLTHKYIPRIEQTEENLFIEEYYSSTDTKIYIEGVEQTEIAYINYSLQEQLKPIYGYASHTFDDVAIGNRIVTGILKTPIKNIEVNNSAEEITMRAKDSNYGYIAPDIIDYNNQEQTNADDTDWIGTTKEPADDSSPLYGEDDEVYEYRNKLMFLGYNVDTNSSYEQLVQAIKDFQQDYNIKADGDLNYRTKALIDQAMRNVNSENTITLPKGAVIYSTPNTSSGIIETCDKKTEAFVVDVFEGDWAYVMTSTGIEGFIDLSQYPSLKQQVDNMKF
jgi:hypothetical protein